MRPDLRTSHSMIRRIGIGLPDAAAVPIRLARWCLAIMSVLLCAGMAHAQSPQASPEFRAVLPAITGRVVDRAGLLDATTVAELTRVLAAHEAATSEQVLVVTVPALNGMKIEDFGDQLAEQTGIGRKGKINGALMIVSRDDRKLHVELGFARKGRMTDEQSDAVIKQIITETLDAFGQNDYAGGFTRGVAAILDVLNADRGQVTTRGPGDSAAVAVARPAVGI